MSERDDALIPAASLGRRGFLVTTAAGTLGAMMAGCDLRPPEDLVPYVRRRPEAVPGLSDGYATAALRGGWAIGLVAQSREGRPIKIEGHPEHPYSLGATGPREQAMVLSLYDPDRVDTPTEGEQPRAWRAFDRHFGPRSRRRYVTRDGEGLFLWLAPSSSPVLAARIAAVRERYPRARVIFDPTEAPLARWEGLSRALGRPVDPDVDPSRAARVVFLDADALVEGPAALRWARQWAARRQPDEDMLRAYSFEAAVTSTGVSCDHRFAVRPSEVGPVALALLAHATGRTHAPEHVPHGEAVVAIARDLAAHRGRCAFVIGERQPAHVHALGALLNAALSSREIVAYRPSALLGAPSDFDPASLYDALEGGAVDTLVTADANPAFVLDGFEERAREATRWIALARFRDETAAAADWVLPSLHPLERWGVHRAYDGTPTIAQPLIEPLVPGATAEALIDRLLGVPTTPRARVAEAIAALNEAPLDEVLARGLLDDATAPVALEADWGALDDAVRAVHAERRDGLELDLRPDVRVGLGEDAENAWLQEMPEPQTQLVWDNAALLSEPEMRRRALDDGDVVELSGERGSVRIPAFGVHGQADGTVVAWLGFGRRRGGRVARGVGVDLAPLRGARTVRVRSTGHHHDLVHVQHHDRLEHAEPILRHATLDEWRADPGLGPPWRDEPPPSLHPDLADRPESATAARWAMGIDLNRCIGCKACVIACQAENDVPVVGKAQVRLGRRMHWLRIDRYLVGHGARERVAFQPMLCQHCEKAPCEYVCPTNATVHSPDGLNTMIYNRCVGTRFCQNNCPYHVRRFNWFDYHRDRSPREQLVFNPDVTVRGRGVMEKCTFCVQRIRRHPRYGRGPLKTACQQACPTQAIEFGDLRDGDAPVTHWHQASRAYSVLGELGTQPRVKYLARVDNVNAALRPSRRGHGDGEG